jgi:hypothetical protein
MAANLKEFLDGSKSVIAARKKLQAAKAKLENENRALGAVKKSDAIYASILERNNKAKTAAATAQSEADAAVKNATDYFNKNKNEITARDAAANKEKTETNIQAVIAQRDRMAKAGLDTTAIDKTIAAAKKKASTPNPSVPGEEKNTEEGGLQKVADNRFKDYTINGDGSVAGPGGTRSYFVSVKNANGSSTLQEYKSVATARDAFLKNYSSPGALDKLKQQLRAKNYISAEQLKTGDWIRGIDDVLGDYTRDAVSAVKYGGAKEAPLIDAWFAKAIGGLGGSGTGSKAGTWKDTDLDLTTIGDANKEINDYMLDALGREATQEEKDAYYADINKREKASAVKTVSTRDATGKVTEATRTGDFVTAEERLNAKNAIVLKALQGTDAGEILKSAKGSQVAVQIGQLQKAAASYGQPISAGEALKYVIEGGTQKDAIAKQTERMRLNAMTMYGNLKEHIRDGGNVKDIADQYALIKSRKLGIPLTDAFNDKDVKAALTKDGGLMSTAEFARQMQANPLWRQTDEARDIASDFANTILKSFGLMG